MIYFRRNNFFRYVMSLLAVAADVTAAATAAGSEPVASSAGVMEFAASGAGTGSNMSSVFQSVATGASFEPVQSTVTASASSGGRLDYVEGLLEMFLNVNWTSPSWDVFIVLFFVVTVFLYGMSLGRDRIIVILVSTYMALAMVANAPAIENGSYALQTTTFLGLFLLLFFLVSRSALKNVFGDLGAGSIWQVMLFSTLQVGLLISVTLSFLPPEATNNLHELSRWIFASDMGRFAWITAPILAMVFVGRGER